MHLTPFGEPCRDTQALRDISKTGETKKKDSRLFFHIPSLPEEAVHDKGGRCLKTSSVDLFDGGKAPGASGQASNLKVHSDVEIRGRWLLAFILISNAPLASADWTGTKGNIALQSDLFLSPDYSATDTRQYNFVSAGMRTPGLGPDNRFENLESGLQASIQGQFSPQAPALSALNISQLYDQESLISIGRKLENWSDLDERWNLGMYQPQFRWNPLRPESQGLSGIFLKMRGESEKIPWGLLVFGSALYLPDQGASYTVKEGKFESTNPWFQTPPKQAAFSQTGVIDQIQYDVQRPENNHILFNTSYAAQFYIGNSHAGFSLQTAYAYKPSNQLSLAVDGDLTSHDAVSVKVNPSFYYHSLLSADAQYVGDLFEAGVGALREKPQAPDFEPQWNYVSYGESNLVSPFVGVKWGRVKIRALSLVVHEPEETVKGPKAKEVGGLLAHRYAFGSANALEASTRFFWRRYEGITGKMRYTQGSEGEFALVTADLQYQMDQRWSLGGQVLLVRSDSSGRKKNIYSNFEDNDSAQVGVLYVF